jgi:hypothetical protein
MSRQAGADEIQHGLHGSHFHPLGADAACRVVTMGERHDQAVLMGITVWDAAASVIRLKYDLRYDFDGHEA